MNCQLCGGNAGRLNDKNEHNLCSALAGRGLPTPNLGSRCVACNGSGSTLKGNGMMLSFDLGPAAIARAMNAIKCLDCKGTGVIK